MNRTTRSRAVNRIWARGHSNQRVTVMCSLSTAPWWSREGRRAHARRPCQVGGDSSVVVVISEWVSGAIAWKLNFEGVEMHEAETMRCFHRFTGLRVLDEIEFGGCVFSSASFRALLEGGSLWDRVSTLDIDVGERQPALIEAFKDPTFLPGLTALHILEHTNAPDPYGAAMRSIGAARGPGFVGVRWVKLQ